jgi:hypothetical protein
MNIPVLRENTPVMPLPEASFFDFPSSLQAHHPHICAVPLPTV